MKKFMALLLAVVMVMGLVACGAAAPAATEAPSNDVAMQYVTADEAKELLENDEYVFLPTPGVHSNSCPSSW